LNIAIAFIEIKARLFLEIKKLWRYKEAFAFTKYEPGRVFFVIKSVIKFPSFSI
jgi:hypothetical protein